MYKRAALSAAVVLSLCSAAALADDKSDAAAAVKRLGDSASYAWTTTVEGGFGRGPTEGKTEKAGYTTYNVTMMEDNYQVMMKGEKALAKAPDGRWMTTADLQKASDDAGGFSPELFVLLRIQNFMTPADQAKEIIAKFQNVKKAPDGSYTADMAEETVKTLLSFRRPAAAAGAASAPASAPAAGGGNRGGFGGGGGGAGAGGGGGIPDVKVTDAKGDVKFWVKDGAVNKMAVHTTGTMAFGDFEPREVDQTATTEIKELGTTKVEVPADVKAKLDAK